LNVPERTIRRIEKVIGKAGLVLETDISKEEFFGLFKRKGRR